MLRLLPQARPGKVAVNALITSHPLICSGAASTAPARITEVVSFLRMAALDRELNKV